MTPLTTDPADLGDLADAIQERWAAGEPPDALAALAAYPALAADRKLVIQLAYEEYCLRTEGGETVDAVAFAARFPDPDDIAALFAVKSALGHQLTDGPARRPVVDLRHADLVGDLQVLRLLGRGGFSDVYLVRNTALGGRVEVLKVSTRGAEEANTLGPLRHPHLMEVFTAPTVNGHRAVVSPYFGLATGETLVNRAAGRPTTDLLLRVAGERRANDPPVANPPAFPVSGNTAYPRAVLHVAAAVADALKYLHSHHIAHRDLKPSNLLFGPTGYPYLLDLNLADDGRSVRVGGTVAYAAPEVIARLTAGRPDAGVDWYAADVFSFAVLVLELLLARHPYLVGPALARIDGRTVPDAARAAQAKLAAVPLPLPRAVRRLLLKCLAVDPAGRPSADELARVLAAAVAPRRKWLPVLLTAAVLTAGGVSAGVLAQFHSPAAGPTRLIVEDAEPDEPFARGLWLVKRNQPEMAVVAFAEAAKADQSGRADEWLSYCYARVSFADPAVKSGRQAEEKGRRTAAVYANRAVGKMLRNDLAGAMSDAAEALKLDPDCGPARLTHAMTKYKVIPRDKPVPRETLDRLEAVIPGNEGYVGLWILLAEARVRVVGATPDDHDRAIVAIGEFLRAGGKRDAVDKFNKVLREALNNHPRWEAVLATPSAGRPPVGSETQIVLPNED